MHWLLTVEIKAIEHRIGALLDQYAAQPDRGPDVTARYRARIAALKADRADLKRLRDDPAAGQAEQDVAAFAVVLDRCGDVVAAMTARG